MIGDPTTVLIVLRVSPPCSSIKRKPAARLLGVTCESDALHVLRLSINLGRKHMGHASKSW